MRLVLVLAVFGLLAAPAAAQTSQVDRAANALRSDSVYVDPDAEAALTAQEVSALRDTIAESDAGPVYVAVLPESALGEAGGSPDALLTAVHDATGRAGTYVVVAGRRLRAGSDLMPVAGIADRALQENEGLPNILQAFVADVGAARSGDSNTADGESPDPTGGLIVLGALVLGGGGLAVARRRRAQREQAAELEEVKRQVRDELVTLGEGIGALDIDMQLDSADPQARDDYGRAVAAYDRANTAWTSARSVEDLAPVGSALEEGRWALASTKARLEGRPAPERRAPCFFDPRHGPSSRDVEWAPPGGAPREVPACEADAQRVERGIDPDFREVAVGGSMVPYWSAGPAFSPFYAGGMFGGFGFGGGLLGGLMLGSMLGPGMAWGAGDWGGGDFGGGGFGGGDFGGGDFGGGDFGGGDFGGGDF